MSIINPAVQDYMTVLVNNNGGATVEFNYGWGRFEVSTDIPDVDLANNQQHVVIVWRTQRGRKVHIKVDDYPPNIFDYTTVLDVSSDTKLDSPQFLYMGRNETIPAGKGFEGCVFSAQFNNLFPLKLAFNDPPLPNMLLVPHKSSFLQDKCGLEELLPPPEVQEVRPRPTIPSDLLVMHRLPPDLGVAFAPVLVLCLLAAALLVLVVCYCLSPSPFTLTFPSHLWIFYSELHTPFRETGKTYFSSNLLQTPFPWTLL